MAKTGRRSFQSRAAATAVPRRACSRLSPQRASFSLFFFRAGGTGYRPLPTRTNIQFKHDCIYQYVFIVHCLPTRRLPSSGQTHSRLEIKSICFHRVYAHPAVFTTGLPLIVSTTGFFFPFCLSCCRHRLQAVAYQEKKTR